MLDASYFEACPRGKRPRRAAVAPGNSPQNRIITAAPPGTLSVWDELSKRAFLVDTGADISVFPAVKKTNPDKTSLVAANGSSIKTFGTAQIDLKFSELRVKHPFCLADVSKPILGSDFFLRHNLIIDLPRQRLLRMPPISNAEIVVPARRARVSSALCGLQAKTLIPYPGPSTSPPRSLSPPRLRPPLAATSGFEDIFKFFPEVLDSSYDSSSPPKHGIRHVVPTEGAPVFARPRRLFGEKLQVAKDEFNKMMEMGIIRPSNSPWSSPLHVVAKAGGGWQPCGDYRKLNFHTRDDRYPLPHIHSFTDATAGARSCSVIDLVRGYHQIPMSPEDVQKTAITTPFGLFEFLRMPFGLKNSAQAFQRLMDGVLRGLDMVFVYLDDILVASSDAKSHREHLHAVLSRLRDAGLAVNLKKCVLGKPEVTFLGHRVSAAGVVPLPQKVDAIQDMKKPETKVELQRFLGMVNYYHHFSSESRGVNI